jgi:biotin-independent malonate decarboxylase gamma subunit
VREAVDQDEKQRKRPIVAIVDVKSQAYGRREETAAIFLVAAAAADAYASARMKGHPVIALVAGQAISGGFLTHGYQANRILAFDDGDVVIHAMHKEAAARITLRSVAELERLGHQILPMSYDIRDYAKLGLLHKLLHVQDPDNPITCHRGSDAKGIDRCDCRCARWVDGPPQSLRFRGCSSNAIGRIGRSSPHGRGMDNSLSRPL